MVLIFVKRERSRQQQVMGKEGLGPRHRCIYPLYIWIWGSVECPWPERLVFASRRQIASRSALLTRIFSQRHQGLKSHYQILERMKNTPGQHLMHGLHGIRDRQDLTSHWDSEQWYWSSNHNRHLEYQLGSIVLRFGAIFLLRYSFFLLSEMFTMSSY